MPITGSNIQVFEIPMSRLGISLHNNIVELNPEECLNSQNLVWANGMVKRGGSALATSDEVVSDKPILGLHKFYRSDGSSELLAACDTVVSYLSSGSWVNAVTGLTAGLRTHMTTWGALDKVYVCNGTDAMRSWDGSTAATLTLSDGVPTQALPYQDRLLTIIGGQLTWSASFDDTDSSWGASSVIGVHPDAILYGMQVHSNTQATSGYQAAVLLAGSNGMYLFYGTDLRWPATTGDYVIYPLSVNSGCSAANTMCWTPAGTMWLGIDRQVYLLPFNSNQPVPIGQKITSNIAGTEGIEHIPKAQMSKASGVYHDGYYKLSVPRQGQVNNNCQWWLDVTRLYKDDTNQWGPWYGPMVGQTISCFANQNGTGDSGELVGGEATDKGYVYYIHGRGYYADVKPSDVSPLAILTYWQSYYCPLGEKAVPKDVHRIELELLNVQGSVNVGYYDIGGVVKSSDLVTLSGAAVYWNDMYWGEGYWKNSTPTRIEQPIDPTIHVRRLSVLLSSSSITDTFHLYAARVESTEKNDTFGPGVY